MNHDVLLISMSRIFIACSLFNKCSKEAYKKWFQYFDSNRKFVEDAKISYILELSVKKKK